VTATRYSRKTMRVAAVLAAVLSATLPLFAMENRAIDGKGNNIAHPEWGSAGTELMIFTTMAYEDGFQSMSGATRPGPREISNAVCAQSGLIPNRVAVTDFVWQWGQFIDHDLDLTPAHDPLLDPSEIANIPTPIGDPFFLGTPIGFTRSIYDPTTSFPGSPRIQMNVLTSFIDASNIYGSDPVRAMALRALDGTGRLKTSAGNRLPFNTFGLENFHPDGTDPALFYISGDVRANEQLSLTGMHTLFMREHNRLADMIHALAPSLSDEEIYQAARRIVGAELQSITYNEFLPVLLGRRALSPYRGYDPSVNPGISSLFSTASYRFGHSGLSPNLQRLDSSLRPIPIGPLPLRNAFFNPAELDRQGGIEPILRGLAHQRMQEIDPYIVDDVRNFLFGPPGSGGFDLPSLNLQRGRDHGLPDYNTARENMGLARKGSFEAISSDPGIRARLASVYAGVDQIDPWVGGLAEDHVPGALVGELVFTVLKDQFERLRDGDRFWYERAFPRPMVIWLERQSLADVIRRNTTIGPEIPDDVFRMK